MEDHEKTEQLKADIRYWQSRSAEERFEAMWQMVVQAHVMEGGRVEDLKLRRDVERMIVRKPKE